MNKLFTKPEIDIYKFAVGDIVYTSAAEGVPDDALINKEDDNNQTGFGN